MSHHLNNNSKNNKNNNRTKKRVKEKRILKTIIITFTSTAKRRKSISSTGFIIMHKSRAKTTGLLRHPAAMVSR